MRIDNKKESYFEEMYANHPGKLNLKWAEWEVYSKQEWIASTLRCDVIYKNKTDQTLHLVEIKRHYADYPNISQVMEYYAKLHMKNIKIDNVYILAKGFTEELRVAMKRCNIIPEEIDFSKIDVIQSTIQDEIEGIFKEPLVQINNITGDLPQFKGDMEYMDFMLEEYKRVLMKTPQSHYFEIWEFKVPNSGGYFLSIKHNGELFHFNKKFKYMQGKKKALTESARNFAWDFFKNNCLEKPYKHIIIQSYDPLRAGDKLDDDKKKIDDFIKAYVNPKFH
ncbi:hypothetical protein [Bacillus sp. FDAARGOS_235]|uniref:hypothetical protein n=1 Tax=Bacillus sp. FDAARGOS_235 TaxID=1839798 RepID=UPI0011A363CD|nr:hypothetical protein [Bacillus sp. FDAARGOS_235]